ncbi:MAG: ADP-ribosylglycohydrolase family protein [Acidimicrobiia bacterium]|nr:ADP-ribosylglycohydrolase family protein [Acidimicrobiia bacterium]
MTDRAVGCLLGLAVGDALGAAVEFQPPGTFPPVTGMRDGGPHGLAAGEWTDDTAMALALADSILTVGWDPADQARRYLAWWEDGRYSVTGTCFDIGSTTAESLARFRAHPDPAVSGLAGRDRAGNGSIMRLAPVAIAAQKRYPDDLAGLAHLCVESSAPTHRAPQAVSACVVLGVVLAGLLSGETRSAVLDPGWVAWDRLPFDLDPEVAEVVAGSHRDRRPPEIVGSGYAVRSLEAALWAFGNAADFADAVLTAVNLGDDADTTGAVCGQIAGACWGASAIPSEWRAQLAWADRIEGVASGLAAADI